MKENGGYLDGQGSTSRVLQSLVIEKKAEKGGGSVLTPLEAMGGGGGI